MSEKFSTARLQEQPRRWPSADEDPYARALASVASLPLDDPLRRRIRDWVVCENLRLARQLAARFANTGEQVDDLYQAAAIGLVVAADRFDASHGVSFAGFASATILGELRHHFRDRTWSIRVERRLQERQLEIRRTSEDLVRELGREPRRDEIAERLGVTVADIDEALMAGNAYRTHSLNAPVGQSAEVAQELGDTLPVEDRDLESVADRHAVLQLVRGMSPSEKRLLSLRFGENLTQNQIAAVLGVSQMQVSRLLTAALAKLRSALLEDGAT
jgi:RNA polymerase sigma-B factor